MGTRLVYRCVVVNDGLKNENGLWRQNEDTRLGFGSVKKQKNANVLVFIELSYIKTDLKNIEWFVISTFFMGMLLSERPCTYMNLLLRILVDVD